MRKILVNTGKPYEILIEDGLIDKIGDLIKPIYKYDSVFIVTDERVAGFYLDRVKKALSNYKVEAIVIEGYEKAKCFDQYIALIHALVSKGLRRNHLLIALGGGVIGDLTGFVAATLYRGVDFIQVPTSLLAQTDSSIGGKTGIDIEEGKNLVGAFYQPKLVIIDPLTLNTLPKKEYSVGLAEMIKHGLIYDSTIVERLEKNIQVDEDILYDSIMVKAHFVKEDEFDQGLRMMLNFGHTFGHAIEKKTKYVEYSHGEAVAIGMLMAIKLGEDLGVTKPLYSRVEGLLAKAGLPTTCFDTKEYIELIKTDKKNLAGTINFILLESVGKAIIYPVSEEKLKEVF